MSLRELCHFGHDRLSHADVGPGQPRADCLALGCTECHRYVNEFDPAPKKRLARPATHPAVCRCARCKAYLEQEGKPTTDERTTDPWGPDFSGP